MSSEKPHWKHVPGRLETKKEKAALALTYPSNFAESVLRFELYPKQRQALDLCREEGSMVSIACSNGGGKSARLIPALVLWHQSLWPAGRVKCTSGSYDQLDTQIWPSILAHKERFPKWRWLETPWFESRDHETGREGFFHGFSTNDPGKAEGAHSDGPDAPLLYIVDECKSVPDWLQKVVVGRVRPTRLVLLSSHGYSEGWFFESQTLLKDRYKTVRITADDCAHITEEEKEQVRRDFAGNPAFVDSVLGYDFMPMVEDAVINGKALDDLLGNPPAKKLNGEVHAFCDFAWSGSGDENVLALRRGNVITIEKSFHNDHLIASPKNPTPGITEQFIAEFIRLGLSSSQISGDEGGGGQLVMDELDRMGWVLNRINNGSPANDSNHYANVAAEMWYECGKQITLKSIVLPHDQKLRGQLLSRKQAKDNRGRLAVESKFDMRKRGVCSPDYADAVAGCCMPSSGYSSSAISWAMAMPLGRFQPVMG